MLEGAAVLRSTRHLSHVMVVPLTASACDWLCRWLCCRGYAEVSEAMGILLSC